MKKKAKSSKLDAGKGRKKTCQYTIRGIPQQLDRLLRERARNSELSLNEVTLEAIKKGIGNTQLQHDDLDSLAGTWQEDKAFEEALVLQNKVDRDLWD